MTPDRWERVKAVFDAAIDKDPDEVAHFLDSACAGDREVRAQVESLIASDRSNEPFLDSQPPTTGAALLAEAFGHEATGTIIGNYQIIEPIASGGMGMVYRAVRADGAFDQVVAIKLIRRGLATEDILRRFRQERQTLAALNHPNIGRLLDGGATDSGSPYLVMEFIEGRPIHEYCDGHKLTIEERLKLFRTVCSAVEHAHRNLVVHRDLKPGHILITRGGEPKLVDFGIAKIIGGDGTVDAQTITADSERLLTPQYASPEQVRGEPISTASDVYSLGVIFYELLSGLRPYDLRGIPRAEMERLITEINPPAPSLRCAKPQTLNRSDGTSKTITPDMVAADRSTNAERLCRSLAGDLDTIVLTAMHKDVARRYSSVEQFSADIQRHLDGMPVRARRDTFGYRAGKFIRRHKVGVLASVLILLSLAGGTIGTVVGLIRTASALNRAESETTNARREAQKALRVNNVLQTMLAAVNPYTAAKDVTVKQVLDMMAPWLGAELVDQPDVASAVHYTIGTSYASIGEFDKAERHLNESISLGRSTLGPNHPEVALSLCELGNVFREKGNLSEAQSTLEQAIAILELSPDENGASLAKVHVYLGKLYGGRGNYEVGREHILQAVSLAERKLGPDHQEVLETKTELGSLSAAAGQYDEAERIYKEVLETAQRALGADHPRTIDYTQNLAVLFTREGKFTEAEPLYKQALAASSKALGERHPTTLTIMNNLAKLMTDQGLFEESLDLSREVLEARRILFGDDHPDTLSAVNGLGMTYYYLNRLEESQELLEGAHARIRTSLGPENPLTLTIMNNLALVYYAQSRYDAAEPLFVESLETSRRVLGEEHVDTLDCMNNLGLVYVQLQRYAEAEPLFVKTLKAQQAALPEDHPLVLASMNNLASLYTKQERYTDAEPLFRQTLTIRRRVLGDEHQSTLTSMSNLARALSQANKFDEATSLFTELLQTAGRTLPADHWLLGVFKGYYGDCLMKMKRWDEARDLLVAARAIFIESLGPDHARTHDVTENLIRLFEATGQAGQAAELRKTLEVP